MVQAAHVVPELVREAHHRSIDPETVFPRTGPSKGDNEMTIAELRESAAAYEAAGLSPHGPYMALHRKFSIPAACFVFALLGLAFGLSNRRDGKLASFVLGVSVIFAYYVILWLGQAMAKGQIVAPWLAVWLPNLVLGAAGVAGLAWRARSVESRLPLARLFSRVPPAPPEQDTTGPIDDPTTGLESGWLSRLRVPFTSTPCEPCSTW